MYAGGAMGNAQPEVDRIQVTVEIEKPGVLNFSLPSGKCDPMTDEESVLGDGLNEPVCMPGCVTGGYVPLFFRRHYLS